MIKESKNCPVCSTPLPQELLVLTSEEIRQGGKNIHCPSPICKFLHIVQKSQGTNKPVIKKILLWISADNKEPIQSVPIILKQFPREKFSNASTELLIQKGLLQYV